MNKTLIYCLAAVLLSSCLGSRTASVAGKKYPAETLKKDYLIFRGALEESHPSLYWFTPKEEMDRHFDQGFRQIRDSMTEREFRTLLLSVITPIRCGHTTVNYSKTYSRFLDTARLDLFPLAFKVWDDTLAVILNLNRKDSLLKRGTVVTSINNRRSGMLIDTLLRYTTGDGYSETGRYQTLSSYGTFGVLYKNVLGLTDSFAIRYLDPYGFEQETVIPVFRPAKDSALRSDTLRSRKYAPGERKKLKSLSTRNVQVDTTLKSAFMTLNTFGRGHGLRSFFKNSFKTINKLGLEHLVIDVRSNGGGDASNSTLLTQYLSDHSFVIADSLYAIKRSSYYRDHIPFQPFYWLMTTLVTKKRADGNFHFGYFERHRFRPFRKHHFDGKVYILTGGNSFSATTLFVQELKGQPNVVVVGEETGGGAYGNSAWIIPQLKLPYTKLKLSIPKFRLVMRKELVEQGRGVLPDIHVAPTAEDIRRGVDVKLEAVRRLVMEANGFY